MPDGKYSLSDAKPIGAYSMADATQAESAPAPHGFVNWLTDAAGPRQTGNDLPRGNGVGPETRALASTPLAHPTGVDIIDQFTSPANIALLTAGLAKPAAMTAMRGLAALAETMSPDAIGIISPKLANAMRVASRISAARAGSAPPESGQVSAEGFPRGGTTPAPEPPSPSDAPHMDMSQRVPAGALTQAQIGERLAAVNAQGGPSTLPPQAVEALGRTRAARQAAAGDANAAPTSISEPAAPVSQPASDVPQPQASRPAPKPMSRQQTLNELALAARRAKISLNGEDYGALQVAVRDGMTPFEAVAALAKARMSPIEQLAGSGSFAGLPSEADVAAAVAKRNNSGQWKPPTADADARWRAARDAK